MRTFPSELRRIRACGRAFEVLGRVRTYSRFFSLRMPSSSCASPRAFWGCPGRPGVLSDHFPQYLFFPQAKA
eukprot:2626368-Pyramimonas_sp.AAC.1